MYVVKLTYFHESGKYGGEGNYNSYKNHLYEIFEEVKDKRNDRFLPGMTMGHSYYRVLIGVPGHPHNHPHLII